MKFKSFLRDDDPVVVPPSGEITISAPVAADQPPQEAANPPDIICCDVALFIRLLEFARENAKTDIHLHEITEHALKLGVRTLTMDDYPAIVSDLSPAEDNPNAAETPVQASSEPPVVDLSGPAT